MRLRLNWWPVPVRGMMLLVLFGGACGIPPSVHNLKLSELARCKSDLVAERSTAQQRLGEVRQQKDALANENRSLQAQAAKLTQERQTLAKNLMTSQAELDALRRAQQLADERSRAFQDMVSRLRGQGLIAEGKLVAEVRPGRLLIRAPEELLFTPNSDGRLSIELRPEGQQALREIAAALREVADRDFLIAGHSDSTPPGPGYATNWELSAARAAVVAQFLLASGMDPRRLGIAGYSEFAPLTSDRSPAGRARNRRIEIIILPRPEELPQVND